MTDWLWQHVIGPAVGGVFGLVPWWVWIIVAGLAIGWAWRTFGWQGIVGAGGAVLGLLAYRKGWRDRDSLEPREGSHPDPPGPDLTPKPAPHTRPKRRRYNPVTGQWEEF